MCIFGHSRSPCHAMLDQTPLAQLSSRLGWAIVGNVFAERISKQSFEGIVRRWRHTSASRPKKLPSLLRHSRSRPRTHFSAPFTFTSPQSTVSKKKFSLSLATFDGTWNASLMIVDDFANDHEAMWMNQAEERQKERSASCNLPFDDLLLRADVRDVAKSWRTTATREFIKILSSWAPAERDLQLRRLPQKAPHSFERFPCTRRPNLKTTTEKN